MIQSKEPSSEWTVEDRLSVVNAINEQLIAEIQGKKLIFPKTVSDAAERVSLAINKSAEFLELNRAFILNGLSFS